MSVLQKMHSLIAKVDPVVNWGTKHNLYPSVLYPPEKPAPDIVTPMDRGYGPGVPIPGTASTTPTAAPRRYRKASVYLNQLGGGASSIGG